MATVAGFVLSIAKAVYSRFELNAPDPRSVKAITPPRATKPECRSNAAARPPKPQPCGFFGDSTRECRCTPAQIQRYVSKISGPLLDRIDIHIEVPAVRYRELRAPAPAEGSAEVRERVMRARQAQLDRFAGEKQVYSNAQMSPKLIRKHCQISAEGEKLLENAMAKLGLSARAHDRVLKVSRTIADLEGAASVEPKHLMEAVQYRSLDRSYWS